MGGKLANGALPGIDVAAFLHAAGFSGDALVTAVAISREESGWIPERRGGPNTNGTFDWGLMQINDVHKPTDAEKTQPLANAKRAFAIYTRAGKSFSPWATYTSGKYKDSLAIAKQSVTGLQNAGSDYERKIVAGQTVNEVPIKGSVPITQGIPGIPNPLDGMAAGFGALSGQFNKIAGNATAISIAVVLLVLGVVILLRSQAISAALPGAGKILKAVK